MLAVKNRPHKCEFCNKGLSDKRYLKAHIESVHEEKKPHKCGICNAKFGHISSLNTHIEKHETHVYYLQ